MSDVTESVPSPTGLSPSRIAGPVIPAEGEREKFGYFSRPGTAWARKIARWTAIPSAMVAQAKLASDGARWCCLGRFPCLLCAHVGTRRQMIVIAGCILV